MKKASPSSRRAWIEMLMMVLPRLVGASSPSSRRAWISAVLARRNMLLVLLPAMTERSISIVHAMHNHLL